MSLRARYSNDYAQGIAPLWVEQPLDAIAAWAHDERIRGLDSMPLHSWIQRPQGYLAGQAHTPF